MRFLRMVLYTLAIPFIQALEKNDLVGKWSCKSEGQIEEGVSSEDSEIYEFSDKGTYDANGVSIFSMDEDQQRVLTIGGPHHGTWIIKEDEMHILTKEMKLSFFSSALADVTKLDFMKVMPEMLAKPTVYTLVSQSATQLVFEDKEDDAKVTFTRIKSEEGKRVSEMKPRKMKSVNSDRENNVRFISSTILTHDKFKFAKGLPTLGKRKSVEGKLRPTGEILDRFLCQYLTMLWVVSPEKQFSEANLKELIELCGLQESFLKSEKEILKTPRVKAQEVYLDGIGWTFENMSALGWVLGFDVDLDIDCAQAGAETMQELAKSIEAVWKDKKAFAKTLKVRSLDEVIQAEDFFYCCHNAFRSAQTGVKGAIPDHFHPIKHGGIIHEKRHVLTWALSPKVKWEDTDLST